ncbi:hypothetical protein JYT84_00610 [bacterium AH-315-M10]|nr:hypothetical protein [bacterium AH-315-M10]MBN4054978.1 hypothetical protein [Acidimicrobium ferrooxidans]
MFNLYAKNNRAEIVIHVRDDGLPAMLMFGANGKPRVGMGENRSRGILSLHNATGGINTRRSAGIFSDRLSCD